VDLVRPVQPLEVGFMLHGHVGSQRSVSRDRVLFHFATDVEHGLISGS
jgi:hypothetical protein